ncbi:hypothetical protein [Bradyrhizobium japonicum]|uniref:hypothetical protein n=1 Tax=Bradyrhizobium japonicum TaxID=375 RepID=UPI001B89FC1E|nr:hypothetical protein [Bradyrhizobium japonicum]MBR0969618.1 hypothetical protein [Bradyrhizobium japonicum]
MAKRFLERSGGESKQQTGREARPSVLPLRPALRMVGRHYFDAKSGSLISDGVVEVLGNVSVGEGFVCPHSGVLRPVKLGCGRGCICIQCDAEPRRDGKPPKATVATCPCIKCQLRRERRA